MDDENMAGGVPQTSEDLLLMIARLWESDVIFIFSIDNPLDIMDCM